MADDKLKSVFSDDIESRATIDEAVDRLMTGLKQTLATLDGWTVTITLKKPQ